jgi:hypothetical protein
MSIFVQLATQLLSCLATDSPEPTMPLQTLAIRNNQPAMLKTDR